MLKQNTGTLFSIGHGRKAIENFIEELKSFHIEYLIDVRSVPFSRFNPQYNQKKLKACLEEAGITYVFLGDLLGGRPQDETCYVNGKISYEITAGKHFFKEGLKRLFTAFDKEIPAVIMCSETKPADCHRSMLIGKTLLKNSIDLIHITDRGKSVLQSELTKGNLFE